MSTATIIVLSFLAGVFAEWIAEQVSWGLRICGGGKWPT